MARRAKKGKRKAAKKTARAVKARRVVTEAERLRAAGRQPPPEVRGKHSAVLTTSNGMRLNRAEASTAQTKRVADGEFRVVSRRYKRYFSKAYPSKAAAGAELRRIRNFSDGGPGDKVAPAVVPDAGAVRTKAQRARAGYDEAAARKAHSLAMDLAQGRASPAQARRVNLLEPSKDKGAEQLALRIDRNSHVALRFYRGDHYSEAVVIGDGGSLQTVRMNNEAFDERFSGKEVAGNKDEFAAAEKLLAVGEKTEWAKANSSPRAMEVLKEVVAAKLQGKQMALASVKRRGLKGKAAKAAIAAAAEVRPLVESTRLRAAAERGAAAGGGKRGGLPPGRGIGAFCRERLKAGEDTAAILKAVQKQFPGARTTPACVAWYRNDMRQKGDLPRSTK